MSSTQQVSGQHKNLFQQGYQDFSCEQLKQIDRGLRFTPAVCSLITVYGLYTANPYILFAVAVLGMWAFFFPAGHPMDLFYNHVICRLTGAQTLPPNPFQRRLACFAAGIMNTMAGGFFLVNMATAAYVTGIALLFLQAIVIFTHFCTLSWMYEKLLKIIGLWERPIDLKEATKLLENGAILVDVRGPDEFARGHLANAVNLPLDDIEKQLHELSDCTVLLYCASGARSQIALSKLRHSGLTNVWNLGGKARASRACS